MEHVVFFTEKPGEPEFRRVGDLEEAVRLVESLRNERGIADVSVHALTPVPVSFRTYYRVEVGAADVPSVPPPAGEWPVEAAVEVASELSAAEVPSVEAPSVEAPSAEAVSVETVSIESSPFETEFGADFEVPSLADEAPAASSLALLPPPVESGPVFDLDEPVDEAAPSTEVPAESEAAQDELESLAAYEPLVPQVRPEPDAERSLGYFAN